VAYFRGFFVVTALLALMAGCATDGGGSGAAATTKAATSTVRSGTGFERLVAWGNGSAEVGGTPRGTERMAEGPTAVAVGPDGAPYVLDRLNGRVLRVTSRAVETVAAVPVDSEDLAVAADSATGVVLAAWSPVRARVWLRAGGQEVGRVTVPRVLRLARGIALVGSRQVLVRNAHQETYRLGSPAAGRTLAAVLRSKREGAFFLADGSGVQVRRRVADGRAEVLVLGAGERTTVTRRILLDDVVMAVRLVGVAAGHLCLRLEKADNAATRGIGVRREALCLRVDDGAEVLRKALPPPGRYLPRRDLAVGGSPARLVFMHPTSAGLDLQVWALGGATTAAGVTP